MTATIFRTSCVQCRCRLRIPSMYLHQVVRCRQCRHKFRVKPRRPRFSLSDTGANANVFSGLDIVEQPFPKRSNLFLAAQFFGLLVLCLSVLTLCFIYRDQLFEKEPIAQAPAAPVAEAPPAEKKPDAKAPPAPPTKTEGMLPRRLLAICVSQYLYANPVSFSSSKKSPAALVERLGEKYGIAKSQQFLVTDVKSSGGAVPPLKPIMQQAIERFAESSRPQDRVMLLFAGHAVVIDGKSYLVPLEGELGDAATLIPLDWVYDQLKNCKARQKVMVIDVNRFDPGRGTERPSAGAMDALLETALKNPPEGVQVWSACSAKQFSYEFRYQSFDKYEVEGGLFLNQIFNAFMKHGNTPPKAVEALPIDVLATRVAPLTEAMARGVVKESQTPFLAGAERPRGAAYNPEDAPPKTIAIPKPRDIAKGSADVDTVKLILDEIKLPPIKAVAVDELSEDVSGVLPFSADTLKAYAADYESVNDLLKEPEKYPLRVAVIRAVETLQRHGKGEVRLGQSTKQVGRLKMTFEGPLNDAAKKAVEVMQRAGPAVMLVELEEVLSSLEELQAKRAEEPSKRWQAHYDYVLAIAKCRFAYVSEYNLMLGKIRKDELPTLDATLHNGWRMASQEKMAAPRDVKDKAEEAKEAFSKIIKEHPGTPWEVLARRERSTMLGLVWQPASIKEPAAAEPAKQKRRKGK